MTTFKDTAGREWRVAIDVYLLEQVQKRTDVRLDKLIRDGMAGLMDLLDDPVKFVRVLWVLVEEQAEKVRLEPEQFGRALGGDALEAAAGAFMEALADFSPSRPRALLRAMAAKSRQAADHQTAQALAQIEAIDPTSSGSATSSPESSASTPAPAG